MCGIAGIVDYENERQTMSWDILKAMQDTMRRRGPDQNGIWHDRFVSLVHARLSIMDPEHGLQPMHMQEGSIVYNGELYNGGELRAELKQAGYQFQTKCDTEVVLAVYLVELCAIIAVLTSSLGDGDGIRGMVWRFCLSCPIALVVFWFCIGVQLRRC